MILLDTNVLSQPLRADGEPKVIDWIDAHTPQLYIPAHTISELVYGVELIDDPDRKIRLTNALAALRLRFEDRYVPFDTAAAEAHGWLQARMHRSGGRLPEVDSQIAAIAISRKARIATRNTKDFQRTGVELIDPWTA